MKSKNIIESMTQRSTFTWIGLFFANGVVAYLVFGGIVKTSSGDEIWPYVIIPVTIILTLASFFFHSKTRNGKKLKERLGDINLGVPKLHHHSDVLQEQFQQLSEQDKRKFKLAMEMLANSSIAWAFAESINISALACLTLGMSEKNYYGFFALSVVIMLLTYPRHQKILNNL